ncbi:MAG: DUF2029 domain-containing protein [Bacteroidetes bacterium]|nr:DUF2029 domain-containing protein [Bacteroidota bacterium]
MNHSFSILKPLFDRKVILSFILTSTFLTCLYLLNFNNDLTFLVLMIVFCSSLFLYRSGKQEKTVLGILAGISAGMAGYYLFVCWQLFFSILEWDFLAFYVYGKAGAEGLQFYNPESFTNILAAIHLPFEVSKDFADSIIKVGVSYPPTTMLMLAPFGFLDLYTANILWRTFIISFLVLDILLIYRIFLAKESRLIHLLIIMTLILIFRGSLKTVYLSQTVFLMLFCILLIYRDPDNWKSGIYLAIAVMIKPIAIVWGLYYLVNRRFKPFYSFVISGVVLVALTIFFFGINNFVTYFTSNPTLRIPAFVYNDNFNQSLNAVFGRFVSHYNISFLTVNKEIIIAGISIFLIGITCIASFRLAKQDKRNAFMIFVPLSLLVYPGCLVNYTPMLLPIFFCLLHSKEKICLPLATAFLLIAGFSTFTGNLAILIVLVAFSFLNLKIFTATPSMERVSNS